MKRAWILAGAMMAVSASSAMALTPADAPPSFWTQFWDAAKAAGFFGTILMAWMWWRAEQRAEAAHAERVTVQNSKDAQINQSLVTMVKVEGALQSMEKVMDKHALGFAAVNALLARLESVRERLGV